MDYYDEFGNISEEAEMQETERQSKKIMERQELLEEAFNGYFSTYFPKYLSMQGPWIALKMMKHEDVIEFARESLKNELAELEACRASLQKEKTSDDSDVFRRAITRLMDAADDQSLSAKRLRELITNEFETCMGLQTEEEVMEEIERMREEYEQEGNDEDDRQFLLDEQERIYRDSVL